MGRLIFNFGIMGCSKTAMALMTKFQYEQKDMNVWLIKPSIDTRADDKYLSNRDKDIINTALDTKKRRDSLIESRIGIKALATNIFPEDNIIQLSTEYLSPKKKNIIICDEAQFLTESQIEDLRSIVDNCEIPVICYGLRTDFRTKLFAGSKRLFEIADEVHGLDTTNGVSTIKPDIVNARIVNNTIDVNGEQVLIGDDNYKPMSYKQFQDLKLKEKQKK